MFLLVAFLAITVFCSNLNGQFLNVGGKYEVVSIVHPDRESAIQQIEIVYEIPSSIIRGVIFVAHGCQHSSIDWWRQSSTCPNCRGLPMEVSITSKALEMGLIVIAISSNNRMHKCWTQKDLYPTIEALKYLYHKLSITFENTPLFLLGVSSGGSFVGSLAQMIPTLSEDATRISGPVKVAGICVQISNIVFHSEDFTRIPPTYFVYMSKDANLSKQVTKTAEVIKRHLIPVETHSCDDKVVDDSFLQSLEYLNSNDRSYLMQSLRLNKIISSNGKLLNDPRSTSSNWRQVVLEALPNVVPRYDSLVADESPMSELVNVAWSSHEITDENIAGVLKWLLKNAKSTTMK